MVLLQIHPNLHSIILIFNSAKCHLGYTSPDHQTSPSMISQHMTKRQPISGVYLVSISNLSLVLNSQPLIWKRVPTASARVLISEISTATTRLTTLTKPIVTTSILSSIYQHIGHQLPGSCQKISSIAPTSSLVLLTLSSSKEEVHQIYLPHRSTCSNNSWAKLDLLLLRLIKTSAHA